MAGGAARTRRGVPGDARVPDDRELRGTCTTSRGRASMSHGHQAANADSQETRLSATLA